jgi:hypothetical protein
MSSFTSVACGKRCYNALVKQVRVASTQVKKRVLWHNDGPTPDVSSISVVIDWLTTGNYYSRYRGGDGHSGDSKTTVNAPVTRRRSPVTITAT